MKREISIKNFGPIENITLDIDKSITTIIGSQASGKSTISKVVYFCLKIKDYLIEYTENVKNFMDNHYNEYYSNFLKFLRKKFIAIFGTTKHMRHFQILYRFDNESINITLGADKYVFFGFSRNLKYNIQRIISDFSNQFLNLTSELYSSSLQTGFNKFDILKLSLTKDVSLLFKDERDIMYVPAGRSLLSTLCEQLHDTSLTDMDLTMRDFIFLIDKTRRKFGTRIPEMITDYLKTVKGQINNAATEYAYELIKKILKADYINDTDGEKMYFDDEHWVKLMFASSGQQEALWIVLLLFSIILENSKTFIIIEEPEAHLFPIAQKYMVELIALCANSTDSSMIITTHSPYVITSLNVLLLSNKIENNSKAKAAGNIIIPKLCRLKPSNVSAFSINKADDIKTNCNSATSKSFSEFNSLIDSETHLISTEFIDTVSEITNDEIDQLMQMGVDYDL